MKNNFTLSFDTHYLADTGETDNVSMRHAHMSGCILTSAAQLQLLLRIEKSLFGESGITSSLLDCFGLA